EANRRRPGRRRGGRAADGGGAAAGGPRGEGPCGEEGRDVTRLLALWLALAAGAKPDADKTGPLGHLGDHKSNVLAVAVSKDGKAGWSLDEDGKRVQWDLGKRKEAAAPDLKIGRPLTAAFSADGAKLAIGLDGKIAIHDVATGKEVNRLTVIKGLGYRSLGLS